MPLMLTLVFCMPLLTSQEASPEGIRRPPDVIRQYETVSSIRLLDGLVAQYRADHGRLPATLDAVKTEYGLSEERIRDGWQRRLVYFASRTHFVLMSFGRSGPQPASTPAPMAIGPDSHYDTPIVMIDGEWAQLPLLD
jgi:hypothetical protein